VDDLVRQFRAARFLFMARDPYAVVEGILRRSPRIWSPRIPAAEAPAVAATHVITCLRYQRRNIESSNGRGVFFSYERMCAEPVAVAQSIAGLVPELKDVNLRQRLRVKQSYDEMLRNMNDQQIARLSGEERRQLREIFARDRDVLEFFGYSLRD
jgi:hypothetical protein